MLPLLWARVPNLNPINVASLVSRRDIMQPILESCCGLEVHKSMVMACIAYGPLDKSPMFEIRKFSMMTNDLQKLKEWLKEYSVSAVAMESTGIYW
jgi:hypothetical protein